MPNGLFAVIGNGRIRGACIVLITAGFMPAMRGIIFISHDLQDIFAVSDRITVMRRGIRAGERAISGATHDEVAKLMIGG